MEAQQGNDLRVKLPTGHWQARADGSLIQAPPDEAIPFWVATHFQADLSRDITEQLHTAETKPQQSADESADLTHG